MTEAYQEGEVIVNEIIKQYDSNEKINAATLNNVRLLIDLVEAGNKDLHSIKNIMVFFLIIAILSLIVSIFS